MVRSSWNNDRNSSGYKLCLVLFCVHKGPLNGPRDRPRNCHYHYLHSWRHFTACFGSKCKIFWDLNITAGCHCYIIINLEIFIFFCSVPGSLFFLLNYNLKVFFDLLIFHSLHVPPYCLVIFYSCKNICPSHLHFILYQSCCIPSPTSTSVPLLFLVLFYWLVVRLKSSSIQIHKVKLTSLRHFEI
jgi:hypothetical protein